MNDPIADRPPVTTELAEFIATFSAADIPSSALAEVPRALLDLAGVTVIGYTEPAGQRIRSYVRAQGGQGSSTLLGGNARLPPTMAALANGTAGHAFDFDDIGVRAGHVSVSMMPAVLAVAEAFDLSGSAFADAMVIGYEVASRMTRLYDDSIDGPYRFGFHKPSTYAVFGGAAAVSRLLGLDATQVQNALGIAASQTGGLRVNFGTMTKPMHAGVACRTAVEAALLAADGFTASDVAIEGRFGWYDTICRGEGDLSGVVADLGKTFAVEEGMRFKLYPSCGANHSAIEVMLDLVSAHDLDVSEIVSVDVAVDPRNLDVLVYAWPRTGLEGKFSLAYNVAAALVDRAVTVRTFTDDHIATLEHVRSMVRPVADEQVNRDGALITVRTRDGRVLSGSQTTPRGNVGRALSWSDLADKFVGNVTGLMVDVDIKRAMQSIEALSSSSVREITASFSLDDELPR